MKKTTILMTILLLLATMVVAQTAEVRPQGVPVLVYGQVIIQTETGSTIAAKEDTTYTIATYDKNTQTMISNKTGKVGTLAPGYLFESQNSINNDGDSVVIVVKYKDQIARVDRVIQHTENYKSFMDFGIIVIKTTGDVTPTTPKPGELYIHTVKFISEEYLKIGEELITNAMLDNVGETDLDQVKINVLIPDLGIRRSVGPVDIDVDDSINNDVYIEIPDWAQPGDYDVRITVSNDDIRRVIYRIMTVEE